MSIYQSAWTPRGVRKTWERCGITNQSAETALAGLVKGNIVDACAWFDENDNLRVLVADTAGNRRVTYRRTARNFTIETERRP